MASPPPTPQNPTTPPTSQQPVLLLISHSHCHPLSLSRPPNLKFDLRKVSNPPKHIRDAYDGRSKRLREHMLHSEDFASLLDAAKKNIEEGMMLMLRVRARNGKDDQMCPEGHGDAPPRVSEAKEGYDTEVTDEEDAVQFVVGCFCERGKHRSVAFAEELSRHKWPRDWAVEIHHRDVDGVNDGKKKRDWRNNRNNVNRKEQDDYDGVCGSDME